MNRQKIMYAVQVATVALVVAAVVQELSKPEEQRTWHGRSLGLVPYDFRWPTLERFKEAIWNPYDRRVLTPMPLGIGWTINFFSLLDNLGFINRKDTSEEAFLLPGKKMKEILRPQS